MNIISQDRIKTVEKREKKMVVREKSRGGRKKREIVEKLRALKSMKKSEKKFTTVETNDYSSLFFSLLAILFTQPFFIIPFHTCTVVTEKKKLLS